MSETGTLAVVLSGTGGQWRVLLSDGTIFTASLRGRVKHEAELKLAVGDKVVVSSDNPGGSLTIESIEPRISSLSRRLPGGGHGERIVAANIDQVVVVFAMVRPESNERMLDRFLVIAEANDLAPRIVINKVDLDSPEGARSRFGVYERIGYPVHYTSTVTGEGLEELHTALMGRTSVLSGPSGVGKSSLMNSMYPGLSLRVAEISESVNKGRHTTVGALMHPLPDGGFVVDTPGLREVGLWGLPSGSLDQCFPEFGSLLGECRFADCRHLAEPGCAIRSAVEAGAISRSRYESYVKLCNEVVESERQH